MSAAALVQLSSRLECAAVAAVVIADFSLLN